MYQTNIKLGMSRSNRVVSDYQNSMLSPDQRLDVYFILIIKISTLYFKLVFLSGYHEQITTLYYRKMQQEAYKSVW